MDKVLFRENNDVDKFVGEEYGIAYCDLKEKYYDEKNIVFSKEIKYKVNDEERTITILEIDENKNS